MSEHEVYIFDADPERVVSVTVGELRCLCTDEWEHCASDEDDSDIAIPERTCRIARKSGDAIAAGWYVCSECGLVYPPCDDDIARWALQFCPHCGARITEVVGE